MAISSKSTWKSQVSDIESSVGMNRHMGKPTICLGENKGADQLRGYADQLRGNREADQRLCFRYTDITISPLLKSKLSNF